MTAAAADRDASSRGAKPWAKWAGGKRFLVPEILRRLPSKINTYYEPFVGGGAVFFALASENRFRSAVLNDSNAELMNTYWCIAWRIDDLIRELEKHPYEKEHYYAVRALKLDKREHVARAARFIYLNRTCFNGLYRVNSKNEFNVPFGKYKNPTICDQEGLREAGKVIIKAAMASLDFRQATLPAKGGDAVYFDCPYVPASATANFTAYSAGGFGPEDQRRLRDEARRLVELGVYVLLSNSDTPLVRDLYAGFKIEEVQAPRRVNSKGGKRGNVGELLISGAP